MIDAYSEWYRPIGIATATLRFSLSRCFPSARFTSSLEVLRKADACSTSVWPDPVQDIHRMCLPARRSIIHAAWKCEMLSIFIVFRSQGVSRFPWTLAKASSSFGVEAAHLLLNPRCVVCASHSSPECVKLFIAVRNSLTPDIR